MPSVTMTYGSYSFSPVPLIVIDKAPDTDNTGKHVGHTITLTLNGTLTWLPGAEGEEGGIVSIDNLIDELRSAFDTQGKLFLLKCGDNVLIQAYPLIKTLNIPDSRTNWIQTANYTLVLEYYQDDNGEGVDTAPFIKSYSDTWSVEFQDEGYASWNPNGSGNDVMPYVMTVTHTVNAVGKRLYASGGAISGDTEINLTKEAWEQANDYVEALLGWNNSITGNVVLSSGILNIDTSGLGTFNHIRSRNISKSEGSVDVTESWLVLDTGTSGVPGNAIENFTIDNKPYDLNTPFTTITVQGDVRGLETRTYGTGSGDFNITESAFTAASGAWSTIKTRLYHRAQAIAAAFDNTINLNTTPLSRTEGTNVRKGTINYAYSYDDRPSNCISGALMESIVITDNNPTDVFATVPIIGRANGPILQSMDTVTTPTRQIAIEALMQRPTGTGCLMESNKPTTSVNSLLCTYEAELTGTYDQVFKTADTETWDAKMGKYTRNIQWTYSHCSGDAIDTSVC